jgi:hypothetical protein
MVSLQSRGLLPAGAAQYAAAVTSPGPVLWPGARAEHALQVQQVAPSLAPVSQPAGGISGGPSPNAGTQVPDEILAFLISANFYADDWAVAAAAAEAAGENSDRSQALKRQKAGPK